MTGTDTRAPVTRYEIQWQQNDAEADEPATAADDLAGWADATTVSPTPPDNITYTHTGVEGMKRYVYRVRAVNSVGEGAWSAQDDADTASQSPRTHRL